MKRVVLGLALVQAVHASWLDSTQPVTMDTEELSRIWQEVKSGQPVSAAPADSGWAAAMSEPDDELARVLLLAWLQQQNPALPMAENPRVYAAALALHRRALAGQPAACAALAAAYRSGGLDGLFLPVSEQKARWFEQRALTQENIPQ